MHTTGKVLFIGGELLESGLIVTQMLMEMEEPRVILVGPREDRLVRAILHLYRSRIAYIP